MEKTPELEVEVWAVRHGQTFDNLQNLCQGHTDGKLTPEGEEQATILGKRLSAVQFDAAYVSDLGRTKETFQKIVSQRQHTIPVVKYEPLLREKSGGIYEGKSLKLVTDAAKTKNIPIRDFRPQNGECWKDVYTRASNVLKIVFFDLLLSQLNGFNTTSNPRKCLLVSHGGWIMELFNYIKQKEQGIAPTWNNSSRNCCVNIIKLRASIDPVALKEIKSIDQVNESKLIFDRIGVRIYVQGTNNHRKRCVALRGYRSGPASEALASKPSSWSDCRKRVWSEASSPEASCGSKGCCGCEGECGSAETGEKD